MKEDDTMSRLTAETLRIGDTDHPVHEAPLPESWVRAAAAKNYRIAARVIDRYHVALECRTCETLNLARAFTVLNNRPVCKGCQFSRRQEEAHGVGLVYLGRDPDDPHYGRYRVTECGHEIRRQFELIKRVAAGETGVRCEICHRAREEEEARARGWRLVGPNPDGDQNYRFYAHENGCGKTQRIARANMQTGRFACESCGDVWSAEPSALYLMYFSAPDRRPVLKLGMSRDPDSRMRYQLGLPDHVEASVLRTVPMKTGRAALSTEKRLHAELRRRYPEAVVPPEEFSDYLRVVSEIYDISLESVILEMLDRVEAAGSQTG